MDEMIPYLFCGSEDADDAPDPVRVVMRDDAIWFVSMDLCRALNISNHRDAIARLDDDERGSVLVDTPGGPQHVAAVSESGLYALIFRSRKPVARKFRRWVTSEVLPSIRRTGRYEETVAVGHHPQGPSLTHAQIEASLHQHQLRVLAAVRAIAAPVPGTDLARAQIDGFDQIANLAGLSSESCRRAVRLLVRLGIIEVNDPGTRRLLAEEPEGHA